MEFPYVERDRVKRRPALVVSAIDLGQHTLLWTAMITTAGHGDWPHDVDIPQFEALNLRRPSVVRVAKLSTVEASAAQPIGFASPSVLQQVDANLRVILGVASA